MIKVDIISGFLGAGKTTFIKELISKVFKDEKVVLIENEFGEIGIDSGFMKEAGIEVTEMNSGCICCTLVGDFAEALKQVADTYSPDRIIIEPSGVGKLSDVTAAVERMSGEAGLEVNSAITVVDGKKAQMYMKNFGEFYSDQLENASTVVVSRTQMIDEAKLSKVLAMIQEHNPSATVITTPWDDLSGDTIRGALEHQTLPMHEHHHEHNEHHHHDHDDHCGCGHDHHDHDHDHDEHQHHDHDEHCGCGHDHHDHDHEHDEHHHHDHDEHCGCGHDHHGHDHEHDHDEHHHHDHDEHCDCDHDHEHEHGHDEHHHHDHDEHCGCGHDHHGHHHADEIFDSWGIETVRRFSRAEIEDILKLFSMNDDFGTVLRAKGIVASSDGSWFEFDMVPEETEIRDHSADYTGRICVIGTDLKKDDLAKLFSN